MIRTSQFNFDVDVKGEAKSMPVLVIDAEDWASVPTGDMSDEDCATILRYLASTIAPNLKPEEGSMVKSYGCQPTENQIVGFVRWCSGHWFHKQKQNFVSGGGDPNLKLAKNLLSSAKAKGRTITQEDIDAIRLMLEKKAENTEKEGEE